MTTSYTPLLGLALPVTGELQGTWGDVVSNYITSYLDSAVAGTQNLSTDADVTLTKTTNASLSSTSSQYSILLFSGARTLQRTVTVPAASKIYTVINATTGGFAVNLVGAGPTTGISIAAGESALVAWNGSDFIKISNTGGAASFTNVTISGTTTLSSLTASQAVFTDASKNVVSVTNTGTGNNVLSASPTLTGTVGLADLTASGSVTLSGGTANGVLYLNASKVATSGSALTFDGTDFTFQSSIKLLNNDGSGNKAVLTPYVYGGSGATGTLVLSSTYGNANQQRIRVGVGGASAISFDIDSSEQMRLTSTGLGIGTSSPAYKLDVAGTGDVGARVRTTGTSNAASVLIYNGNGTTSALYSYLRFVNDDPNSQDWRIGTYGSNNLSIVNAKAGTTPVVLDTSGNLGLGVTPSAWDNNFKVFQLGYPNFIAGNNGGNRLDIGVNAYFSTNYKYANSAAASYYSQSSGQHIWYTAASGTAGNAITFTQAMTLAASGGLSVGTTSDAGTGNLLLNAGGKLCGNAPSGGTSSTIELYNASTGFMTLTAGYSAAGIAFATGGTTERARIDSSGNFLLGTQSNSSVNGPSVILQDGAGNETFIRINHDSTASNGGWFQGFSYNGTAIGTITQNGTTAVAYNTSSDYRLKDNQQPLTGSGAFIDALKPKTWEWKADGSKGVGFIAHEVQEVSPGSVVGEKDAVDEDGKPIMQAMEYGSAEFIANIIAELQSLRQRVAQLEKGN